MQDIVDDRQAALGTLLQGTTHRRRPTAWHGLGAMQESSLF